MSEPTAYPGVPWRLGPLTEDERRQNLAKAYRMIGQRTDPTCPDPPPPDATVWCGVCIEYEDLLARLGHGIEFTPHPDPRGEA